MKGWKWLGLCVSKACLNIVKLMRWLTRFARAYLIITLSPNFFQWTSFIRFHSFQSFHLFHSLHSCQSFLSLHSFISFAGLGFWPAGRPADRLAATLAGWLAGCRLASAGATVASWFLVCGVRPAGQLGLGLWPAGRPALFVAGRPASWCLVFGPPAGRLAGCEIAGRTKLAIQHYIYTHLNLTKFLGPLVLYV